MKKLGVIGAGSRITALIRHYLAPAGGEFRVSAVVDPDEAGARSRLPEGDREKARFYPTIDEMMRKARPDGLLIGTRCHLHAPCAARASRYDVPLFLEKPVAVSLEQARALEKAFEKSRCPVVVSFPLRVSPLCEHVRARIAAGGIGVPEHAHAVNYVPYGTVYYDHPGYRNYEITQGLFLQKATHDFDYLQYLLDSPITRVAAMFSRGRVFGGGKAPGLTCGRCSEADSCPESPANRRRNRSGGSGDDHCCPFGADLGSPEKGMNEDSSGALLEFASGAQAVYSQVFFSRRDAAARGAVISGYRGTIDFDWYRNGLKFVRHHEPFTDTVKVDGGLGHFGGDFELMRDFIGLVNGQGRSRTPIGTGLQSAYACLAARDSAARGRFIRVRQAGAPRE